VGNARRLLALMFVYPVHNRPYDPRSYQNIQVAHFTPPYTLPWLRLNEVSLSVTVPRDAIAGDVVVGMSGEMATSTTGNDVGVVTVVDGVEQILGQPGDEKYENEGDHYDIISPGAGE